MASQKEKDVFKKEITEIYSEGIRIDKAQLKKDMCAQFSDWREWIREYVVNSSDAGAKTCVIKGFEKDGVTTISITDDGCGMDKQGIKDFFTVYRSKKNHPNTKSVGRHGIGKLSVAAIPGQNCFFLRSSNGMESWEVNAGSLLEKTPIKARKVKTIKKSGTTFEISFLTQLPLDKEMEALCTILKKYVAFLPMLIELWISELNESDTIHIPSLVNEKWPGRGIRHFKTYQRYISGQEFTITMGIGKSSSIIYQNRVRITDKYDLGSYDSSEGDKIPGLAVLVDSPAFQLPFGRHCISNEDILSPLGSLIRRELLPEYYREVQSIYNTGNLKEFHITNYEFELMTSALMLHDENLNSPWFGTPIFRCVEHKMASFSYLRQKVQSGQVIFFADPKLVGIDFSVFESPVLLQEQIGYCNKVLSEFFEEKLVDLGVSSLILEKPGSSRNDLSKPEREFEKHLGFHPELMNYSMENEGESNTSIYESDMELEEESKMGKGSFSEVNRANRELESINWRVSKLVERDGTTECKTHLFIFNSDQTVVLNLHHPTIQQLILLSTSQPELAGHWAMALCLLDDNNILPEISAETREDLLLLDAMSRVNNTTRLDNFNDVYDRSTFKDLLKRFGDYDLN